MPKLKLTCPECCYAALRKVGKYKWRCEECGTTFNLAKMRNSLDALAGRLLPGEFISKLLGDATLQAADEFGERGWKWVGRHGFLYAADCGNDWYAVLKGQKATKNPDLTLTLPQIRQVKPVRLLQSLIPLQLLQKFREPQLLPH